MNCSQLHQLNAHGSKVQKAIAAYNSKQLTSIRRTADAFNLPYTTLRDRLTGAISRQQARTMQQNLSSEEEITLVRWITRLTNTGFPASPKLVLEMAEEIRREHGLIQDCDREGVIWWVTRL